MSAPVARDTQNTRVDDLHRRVRILEAVPPGSGGALPPWFDWNWFASTTIVTISPSSGGGDTNPTTTAPYAQLMVQTDDGAQIPPFGAGTPVEFGTVLGEYKIFLNDPGAKAGDSTGVYILPRSSNTALYKPQVGVNPNHSTIGSGWIKDTSTNATFTAHLQTTGELFVPNIPDLSPPNTGVRNFVRIDWPFAWASGDTLYNGTFMYPMETAF